MSHDHVYVLDEVATRFYWVLEFFSELDLLYRTLQYPVETVLASASGSQKLGIQSQYFILTFQLLI